MALKFKGFMAPVFTPFLNDSGRTLNLKVISAYSNHLRKNGILGVLVNGTTGEGTSMSITERKQVAETWVSNVNKEQHVMVQVGGAPLPDVINLAQHAEKIGVNSILCLPDLFNKPKNPKELISYLGIVGKAAPNTPLLYYHNPEFTNVQIHMGQFLNEMGHTVKNFCGIKFTSKDLNEGTQVIQEAERHGFSIFLGSNTLILPAINVGFESFVVTAANFHPTLLKQIIDNGNSKEYQKKLSNFIFTIIKYGSWVPTMKEAMNYLNSHINCGPVRDPIIGLDAEKVKQLQKDLSNIKM